MEKTILFTAFEMARSVPGVSHSAIICKCGIKFLVDAKFCWNCGEKATIPNDTEEERGLDFEAFSEIVSMYGDGKGDDRELVQVWFAMMDSDHLGSIDYEEFKDIKMILNAPL